MTEIKCINCPEKLSKISKDYPHEFAVYLCPQCGYENDWWIVHGFGKDAELLNSLNYGQLECIIRAYFLDSFLQGKEIMYDKVIQHIKEKYAVANYSADSIQNELNSLFLDVLVNKAHARLTDRYPHSKLPDEKYNKIIIPHSITLDDFFNKRMIRQWDLKHLTTDLKELKEKIKSNPNIRYKNRWLAAFDYFLDHPKKKI